MNDETIKYLHEKQIYHNFVDKQYVISKNKTERLVETFLALNDKYSISDFLNDPMIEDDNLNMKINPRKHIRQRNIRMEKMISSKEQKKIESIFAYKTTSRGTLNPSLYNIDEIDISLFSSFTLIRI